MDYQTRTSHKKKHEEEKSAPRNAAGCGDFVCFQFKNNRSRNLTHVYDILHKYDHKKLAVV